VLTGIIIGFVAGQIVGIVAAAFLAASRHGGETRDVHQAPPPRRSVRFVLRRRSGAARRSSGKRRQVA
jgi:hypothetical protein